MSVNKSKTLHYIYRFKNKTLYFLYFPFVLNKFPIPIYNDENHLLKINRKRHFLFVTLYKSLFYSRPLGKLSKIMI